MNTSIIWDLQLLGEGGDAGAGEGGAGTATGVTSGDAGLTDRLAQLGVPQDRIEKRRKALERREAAAKRTTQAAPAQQDPTPETAEAKPQPEAQATDQPAPAAEQAAQPAQNAQEQKAMTREQMEADPAMKKILDDYANERVRARLKDRGDLQAVLDQLTPALELASSYYGLDTSNGLNYAEISRRMVEDNLYYEDRAIRNGTSVDDEREKSMNAIRKHQQEELATRQKFDRLMSEVPALKEKFPNFDFATELRNPDFKILTGPGMPFSLEDAYYHVHRKEIEAAMQEQAKKAAMEAASRSIQAGQARPVENGATPQAAPPAAVNVRDKSYREALKREIRAAAARGEYVPLRGGT